MGVLDFAKNTLNNFSASGSNTAQSSFNNARAWSRGDYDNAGIVGKLYGWLDNALTGNRDYNRQLALTAKEMAYNATEAQKQRDFEERMSNTSYQRASADALAAGFNPALIMSQGGASSPSGHAASVGSHSVGKSGDQFGSLLSSIFGLVGSLVATGMRTSAMEAAQNIRGQYTIDATKLRGNSALVVAKTAADSRRDVAKSYIDAGYNAAILNNQAAMDRIKEWKKGPEKEQWYKDYMRDLEKVHRNDKRAMKKVRDRELEVLEHVFDR